MNDVHLPYLERCVIIAKRAGKSVKSNPQVGAVLVCNDRIIGEGYHESYGSAHAEVNAISNVVEADQNLIDQSTLYVSLEPCNHTGKTGPCTDVIIKHKIQHVVIAYRDPNNSVKSDGILKLESAGVKVDLIETIEAKNLVRPFEVASLNMIPYVILKFAQSKDFFLGKKGEQVWISNNYTQHLVHKWRSEIDGIMVGKNTVLTDNPKLTNRLYNGDSPIRIIPNGGAQINEKFHVKSDGGETWFYEDTSDLRVLLKDLYKRGINRLMIEGGAQMINSFVDESLWHEARIITGNKQLNNGIKAPVIKGKLIFSQSLADDLIQVVYAA